MSRQAFEAAVASAQTGPYELHSWVRPAMEAEDFAATESEIFAAPASRDVSGVQGCSRPLGWQSAPGRATRARSPSSMRSMQFVIPDPKR